jgi:REP element-mobilizing transposase RayT
MCGKASLFRQDNPRFRGSAAAFLMFQISRTTPAYYLTSVAHERIPVFQSDKIKQVVCDAFNRARISGVIMIFAYVIMPDHTHVITDSNRKIKDILRFLNGNAAKSILNYLKENGFDQSLAKLRIQEREFKHKYSVYQHHPNAFEIYGRRHDDAKGKLHSYESSAGRTSRAPKRLFLFECSAMEQKAFGE